MNWHKVLLMCTLSAFSCLALAQLDSIKILTSELLDLLIGDVTPSLCNMPEVLDHTKMQPQECVDLIVPALQSCYDSLKRQLPPEISSEEDALDALEKLLDCAEPLVEAKLGRKLDR